MAPVLFLDRRAAAEACSVSIDMIDAAVRLGELRAKKHKGKGKGRNGKVVFDPADLKQWVESWEDA